MIEFQLKDLELGVVKVIGAGGFEEYVNVDPVQTVDEKSENVKLNVGLACPISIF